MIFKKFAGDEFQRLRLQHLRSIVTHFTASATTFADIVHSRFAHDQAPATLFQTVDAGTTAIAEQHAED